MRHGNKPERRWSIAYRIIKPFDYKRLVFYLRKQRVYSYATADGVFLAGQEAMFSITPQPELVHLQPPEQDQAYVRFEGSTTLERTEYDVLRPWRITDTLPLLAEVKPTHYLYEPQEKLLLRKFAAGIHTVWLIKTLTDILQPWPGFLEEYYRFELVRDPERPTQVYPVRVLFNTHANRGWKAEWEPIALMMPYALKNVP
jgi:hypothetical protein